MIDPTNDPAEHPLARFLFKKLFAVKAVEHFKTQWLDDVDAVGFDTSAAVQTYDAADDTGVIRVYVMPGGVAAARFIPIDGGVERWAAYETKERVEGRELLSRWADFARGHWTPVCPVEPGLYPVVRRDAAIDPETPFTVHCAFDLRKISRVAGEARDVTTYCPSALRTEWKGWWWSEALPMMLAPYETQFVR